MGETEHAHVVEDDAAAETEPHDGHGLAYLQSRAGSAYSGAARYRNEPSVRDGNLVTANGVGFVDFTCNMLSALKAARQQEIEAMRATFTSGMFTEG